MSRIAHAYREPLTCASSAPVSSRPTTIRMDASLLTLLSASSFSLYSAIFSRRTVTLVGGLDLDDKVRFVLSTPNAVVADSVAFPLIQPVLNLEVEPPSELIHDVLQDKSALVERAFETMTGVIEEPFDGSDVQVMAELIGTRRMVVEDAVSRTGDHLFDSHFENFFFGGFPKLQEWHRRITPRLQMELSKVDPIVKTIFRPQQANIRRCLVCILGAASASKPPLAIPALEPALGSHPCGALSSVRQAASGSAAGTPPTAPGIA